MLGYLVRILLRAPGGVRRRLARPPDFVSFVLEGTYPEFPPPRPPLPQRLLSPKKTISLREMAARFRSVISDPRVKGVLLHIRPLRMTLPEIQSLRNLISDLKHSGKRVVAWSYSYETSTYYLASAADEILMQRGGRVAPLGLKGSFYFIRDALARVGIETDFLQISPYKSAADPLTRSTMAEEVREMSNWLADSNFEDIVTGIAEGRKMGEAEARTLVDGSPYTDLQAEDAGAVDALMSEEEIPDHLGVKIQPWWRAKKAILRAPLEKPGKYVGVLRVEGTIVDGRTQKPPFKLPGRLAFLGERSGDLTVVQEARRLASDRRAAAVVVHVDSGGGSATASEAVRVAFERIAAKKPLVVHMASLAASGGYWISTPARWIVAQPGTITGSIGVLNGKFINSGLLSKLGFNREMITRGENVLLEDPGRKFTDEERKSAWAFIERIYDLFLERVTQSRNLPREQVDSIGGGRVWTGKQALERGLIDQLGGFAEALAKARELAGLPQKAPFREVKVRKQRELAPRPQAAALLEYVLEAARMVSAGPLVLCPITWKEDL